MRDIILNFPEQFAKGIASSGDTRLGKVYPRIICCGMGGSAVPGEILSLVKDNVIVHWDYDLPAAVDTKDLVICTSWSGSTEETISSLQAALGAGMDAIVITKGGALADKARQANIPLVILPQENIPPRIAAGYMTGALFAVLGLENELELALDASSDEGTGKDLAKQIGTKVPLIYTSYPQRKIAGFWKIFFNENSKVHAFANWAPSMVHNEIAGFHSATREHFVPLVLRDPGETPAHKRNLDALLAFFEQMSYNHITVKLSSRGKPLEKVFQNYILGLWTSYYLAQELGVEPENTELIEQFKALKKEN